MLNSLSKLLEGHAGDKPDTEALQRIYEQYGSEPDFERALVEHFGGKSEVCATWLLKHHLSTVGKLEHFSGSRLIERLRVLKEWQAKLHILQCLHWLVFKEEDRATLERFVREQLAQDNKFVRAWAYSGFYVLANQFTQYREECKSFFKLAEKDEPGSVQARLRQLMREDKKSENWLA